MQPVEIQVQAVDEILRCRDDDEVLVLEVPLHIAHPEYVGGHGDENGMVAYLEFIKVYFHEQVSFLAVDGEIAPQAHGILQHIELFDVLHVQEKEVIAYTGVHEGLEPGPELIEVQVEKGFFRYH